MGDVEWHQQYLVQQYHMLVVAVVVVNRMNVNHLDLILEVEVV
jgi:hypothetical protein